MKIGLIARADNTGLGIQTWEFYRHMQPAKTMVVDISKWNGYKQHPERYGNDNSVTFINGFPTDDALESFVEGLDVIFMAESAYNHKLFNIAREAGVKTAVQYNYEFFDWFKADFPKPDMLIAPSQWHFYQVDNFCKYYGLKHIYLHCPVDREKLKFREITKARTFLHSVGRSAAHDRNGTYTVIEASKHLKTEAKILMHFQGEQGLGHQVTSTYEDYERHIAEHGNKLRITSVRGDIENYEDLYTMGDVLLLPRRYGGNCLPMNEALSCGMPVIMSNISPNSEFLPREWLVDAEKKDVFAPRTTIDIYGCDPVALAQKIDQFYNLDAEYMREENLIANRLAQDISWQEMKPKYEEAFTKLCSQ